MKKIVLLFTSFCLAGMVSAQSLSLSLENVNYSNDTLYVSGNPDSDLLEAFMTVNNLTDKEIDVKVKKSEVLIIENTENSFCWGSCFPPFIFEANAAIKIPANGSDFNSFIGDYTPDGNQGTSVLRYTFFIDGNPSDSVSLIVNYQVGTTGVRDWTLVPDLFKAYPNPTAGLLTIEFPGAVNQKISLKVLSITGQAIIDRQLSYGQSLIQIDLSQVPRGYYFLQIQDQNGKQAMRRILKSS